MILLDKNEILLPQLKVYNALYNHGIFYEGNKFEQYKDLLQVNFSCLLLADKVELKVLDN